LTREERARLRDRAHATLRANWREGIGANGREYAFTCPSPRRYPHQWYWDSCFHAVMWARFEPERARAELRTLLRAGRPDGFVPHTVFWHAPARWRRAPLYATAGWRSNGATAHTQTPLLAFAWEQVARTDGDAAFAAEALDPLLAHADWMERERDPDGDALVTILLPDESGLDDSPKYDPVYGRNVHWRPGYFELVARARRRDWDSRTIIAAGDAHLEDVLVNVAHALSLRALARLMAGAGRSGDAQRLEARAGRTESALLARCWDERSGLFFDLAGRRERPVRVSTWSSLSPLALGPAIPEDIRRRLVEEHLLHARRYGAEFGIPSVAIEEPAFRSGFDRWRTWRGASWMNSAWLLVPPLLDLGYRDEARRIVGSLARAALEHGFCEYYDAHTGRGHGARGFGWSTLVVDLVDRAFPPAGDGEAGG
jgi:glycogen debranching enzyme